MARPRDRDSFSAPAPPRRRPAPAAAPATVAAMLLGLLVPLVAAPPTAGADPLPLDLAAGKPTTCVDHEGRALGAASRLVDSDDRSGVGTDWHREAFMQCVVDLGQPFPLAAFRIHWGTYQHDPPWADGTGCYDGVSAWRLRTGEPGAWTTRHVGGTTQFSDQDAGTALGTTRYVLLEVWARDTTCGNDSKAGAHTLNLFEDACALAACCAPSEPAACPLP